MSSAGAECVSAPIEMKSTPFRAKLRTLLRSTPPDISTSGFPPEVFALIFFGLGVSASVGARTLWKGWLSVFLGLLLATMGTDPAGGLGRFDFGSYYLLAGIHFIPLILGFFAVSEVFTQAEKIVTGTRERPKASLEFPTLREFWNLRYTVGRSMGLGFFAGILPGIGATLALDFVELLSPGLGESAESAAARRRDEVLATLARLVPEYQPALPPGARSAAAS